MNNYGIEIHNLSMKVGDITLFEDANFYIKPKSKVGLIGRNGAGKTTLFEYIYSAYKHKESISKTKENINFLPDTKINYLPQEFKLLKKVTVKKYIENTSLFNIYSKYQKTKDASLLDKMNLYNLWDIEETISHLLEQLKFKKENLNKNIYEISAGEITKIKILSVILSGANILLLDEPTNNLDSYTLSFLKNWIKDFPYSVFMISHNRDFLDNTVDEILEINQNTKTINSYIGNYSFFYNKRQEEIKKQKEEYARESKKRKKLKKAEIFLKKRAKEIQSFSNNAHFQTIGARVAMKSVVLKERIENRLNRISFPTLEKKINIKYINNVSNTKNTLIFNVENLSYKPILKNISFSVFSKERIAIIGNNGVGKTTLLKLLIGEIKQGYSGNIVRRNIKIGYVPQTTKIQNSQISIIEYMQNSIPSLSYKHISTSLGSILFRNPENIKVKYLSTGEIKKLQLLLIIESNPEFLILDEPTNHMDISSIEILENILNKFEYGFIVVSHDKNFLDNIKISKIIELKNTKWTDIK